MTWSILPLWEEVLEIIEIAIGNGIGIELKYLPPWKKGDRGGFSEVERCKLDDGVREHYEIHESHRSSLA